VLLLTFANFFGAHCRINHHELDNTLPRQSRQTENQLKAEQNQNYQKQWHSKKSRTTPCMRCGACMTVCCNRLSQYWSNKPETKNDIKELMKLDADFCAGCDTVTMFCPARIDLKSTVLNYQWQLKTSNPLNKTTCKHFRTKHRRLLRNVLSKKHICWTRRRSATALLVSGMQKGMFDAAIVVKRTEGYSQKAFVGWISRLHR